jgi:predicted phage terminase large subunit-like protein
MSFTTPLCSPAEYQHCLRTDLMTFVERSFRELNPAVTFQDSPYIELIASKLEACRSGKIKRLIINLPPRTLKSHTASVAFPAWLLGHKPSTQIICASYGQELSDKHARDCRTVMGSAFYRHLFPQTRLSQEKQSVNDFMTTEQGFRMSTSVGGVLTGRGADFVILDDIMKPDDALSEMNRKRGNEWYGNTLLSRLNSKENGVIIIVMQRLHQDDLVGHILEQENNWEVLALPAIAQQDEEYRIEHPLGYSTYQRQNGQALHPERDSLETLIRIQKTIGDYNFQSQYQQTPMPREGGDIKKAWLSYYEKESMPERFTMKLQSWDTASKSGELNDFSVCTTWGFYDSNFYLLDVFRKRLEYPALKRAFKEQWNRHTPSKVLIEDKSSGMALIQDLLYEGVYGLEAVKPPPGSDKRMRFNAQAIRFESGRVLLPRNAPWLQDYVLEITGFPGTKHDDQVDSTSQALEYMASTMDGLASWIRLGQGY